jgi:hypothetical protein
MGIKEFALRICYDMFNHKTADEPLSEDISSNPPSSMQQHHNETSNTPISKDEAMLSHQIKKMKKRDGSNNPTRRHCSMKEEGCEGKAISYERVPIEARRPSPDVPLLLPDHFPAKNCSWDPRACPLICDTSTDK